MAPASQLQGSDGTQAALDRLRQALPTPQNLLPLSQPSAADRRDSFLNAQLDQSIYLRNGLQKPLSDYEVKAGTISQHHPLLDAAREAHLIETPSDEP